MSINVGGFELNHDMVKIIAQIDEFKGTWRLFGNLSPDYLKQLKKVATIESVGSSTRIEGVKLSDSEVERLLSHLETNSFRSRDEQEVAGYALVCEEIFESYTSIHLTENYIKQLHAMLLKYSDKDQRHRGEYKKLPNHVEAFDQAGVSLGVIFATASPFETPRKMEELLSWTRTALEYKELHPLLIIGIFIVEFLAIHPFQDGNGRLSRLLTTLLLLKSGYVYVPYSSLEQIVEDNKDSYYLALRRTQKTLSDERPDWAPWLVFFLRCLFKQTQKLELKLEPIRKQEILAIPELSAKILELAERTGRITMSHIIEATQSNRNTIKKYLASLVDDQKLSMHGKGKGTWYTLINK